MQAQAKRITARAEPDQDRLLCNIRCHRTAVTGPPGRRVTTYHPYLSPGPQLFVWWLHIPEELLSSDRSDRHRDQLFFVPSKRIVDWGFMLSEQDSQEFLGKEVKFYPPLPAPSRTIQAYLGSLSALKEGTMPPFSVLDCHVRVADLAPMKQHGFM